MDSWEGQVGEGRSGRLSFVDKDGGRGPLILEGQRDGS